MPHPLRRAGSGWGPPLGAAALALALYAGTLGHGFAGDDLWLIEQNPFLRRVNLARFFASDYWEPKQRAGLYRPLVTTSFALDFAVAGAKPAVYHGVNVLLHAVNSGLVAVLALRIARRRRAAWLAGLLFAAHAIHVEPVANAAGGRPELLAALFGLGALWLHAGGAGGEGAHRFGRAAGAAAAFGAALLCKESAAAFAPIAFLYDLLVRLPALRAPARLRDLRGSWVLYGLVALAYLGARRLALAGDPLVPPTNPVDNPLVAFHGAWRAANAAWVALRAAGLLLLPARLSSDYSFDALPLIASPADPRLAALVAAGIGLGAGAILAARRAPRLAFGLAAALAAYLPAANLLLPIGTIFGERLLYLPSFGFCLALGIGLDRSWQRARGRWGLPGAAAVALLAALLVAGHGLRAIDRNRDWRSNAEILLHDVQVFPRSAKLQSNAGAILLEQGRPEPALAAFERAIALGVPASVYVAPFQGRVLALVALERFAEAEPLYRAVLEHAPPHPEVERALARWRANRRPAALPGPG